jgi:hypothetical protein
MEISRSIPASKSPVAYETLASALSNLEFRVRVKGNVGRCLLARLVIESHWYCQSIWEGEPTCRQHSFHVRVTPIGNVSFAVRFQ